MVFGIERVVTAGLNSQLRRRDLAGFDPDQCCFYIAGGVIVLVLYHAVRKVVT